MAKIPHDHHRSPAAFEARAEIIESAGGTISVPDRTIETKDIPRNYGPHDAMDPGVVNALDWMKLQGMRILYYGVQV